MTRLNRNLTIKSVLKLFFYKIVMSWPKKNNGKIYISPILNKSFKCYSVNKLCLWLHNFEFNFQLELFFVSHGFAN